MLDSLATLLTGDVPRWRCPATSPTGGRDDTPGDDRSRAPAVSLIPRIPTTDPFPPLINHHHHPRPSL